MAPFNLTVNAPRSLLTRALGNLSASFCKLVYYILTTPNAIAIAGILLISFLPLYGSRRLPKHTQERTEMPEPLDVKRIILDVTPDEADWEDTLRRANCLEDLTLRNKQLLIALKPAPLYPSPLTRLHAHSFRTLTRLYYRVEIDLPQVQEATRITDPYRGLFRYDFVSRLTSLQKLELVVRINHANDRRIAKESFGEEWNAPTRAILFLTEEGEFRNCLGQLKSIRFRVEMSGEFGVEEGKRLQEKTKFYLFQKHFNVLGAAGWEGEPSRSLSGQAGVVDTALELRHK